MKAKIDSRKKIENARNRLKAGDLLQALSEIEDVLRLDETNTDARTLKEQIEAERRRRAGARATQALEAVEREPSVERRIKALLAAVQECPGDKRLQTTLSINEMQRDVVAARRARVRVFEEHERWDEAIAEANSLAALLPRESGVQGEVERLQKRRLEPAEPVRRPAPQPAKPAEVKQSPAREVAPPKVAGKKPWLAYAAAGVVVLAVAIGFGLWKLPGSRPSGLAVSVQPPDAKIEIDGVAFAGDASGLKAGSHKVRITRPGYAPVEQSLTLPGGSIAAVLQPLPSQVRIDTNLAEGQFIVDDAPPQPLDGGQATVDQLNPGRHVIKVADPKYGEAVFEFEVTPAALPRLTAIPPVKEMVALATTSFDQSGRLHASAASLPVRTEEGAALGQTAPEGLELKGFKPGDIARLVVGTGEQEWRVFNTYENRPVLSLFVRVNVTTGGFLVRADQDGAVVRVNGQAKATLRAGELRPIRGLDPGRYQVRVEKPGYRSDPVLLPITITRGRDEKAEFRLVPVSTIEIRGAAPGAQILVNSANIGVVGLDGNANLTALGVSGPCRIELRREGFTQRSVDKTCTPGQTVTVTGDESKMTYVWGRLAVTVKPEGARVIAVKGGEERMLTPPHYALPEGTYTIRITAPGYHDETIEGVIVTRGQRNFIEKELKPR